MIAVLVHGLGRTPVSLFPLAADPAARGAPHVRLFAYFPYAGIRSARDRRSGLAARLRVTFAPEPYTRRPHRPLARRVAAAVRGDSRGPRASERGTASSCWDRRTSRRGLAARAWKRFTALPSCFARDCGRFLASRPNASPHPAPSAPSPYTLLGGTAGPTWPPTVRSATTRTTASFPCPRRSSRADRPCPSCFRCGTRVMMWNPVVRRRIVAILSAGDIIRRATVRAHHGEGEERTRRRSSRRAAPTR